MTFDIKIDPRDSEWIVPMENMDVAARTRELDTHKEAKEASGRSLRGCQSGFFFNDSGTVFAVVTQGGAERSA